MLLLLRLLPGGAEAVAGVVTKVSGVGRFRPSPLHSSQHLPDEWTVRLGIPDSDLPGYWLPGMSTYIAMYCEVRSGALEIGGTAKQLCAP